MSTRLPSLLLTLFAMLVATVQPLSADSSAGSANLPADSHYSREQLLSDLTAAFAAHYKVTDELALDLIRAWSPPDIAASSWELVVEDYPPALAGSLLVRCRLLADGASTGEVTLVVRANLWGDAWCAAQPLVARSTFNPALLETRRVDLLRERDALPANAGSADFILTRAVAAGHLLSWRDLARRPLVRKGSLVEVSAVEGPLVVTLKAVALENGAQGDVVLLRNRESLREFSATVTDENRVEVHF
ncbi:MAG TPA: flagellar basal body P-ring formation chaperone FlgA [Opitutus sp.]|nr:flagellar basal body P-ring formation chaperone FlgA [Opitutus sp.]